MLSKLLKDTITKDEASSSEEESEFIYSLVKAIKPLVCLETGTRIGATSYLIAQAIQENGQGRLWTYDVEDFGVRSPYVNFIQASSDTLDMPEVVNFAFLDASHETDFVVREFKNLLPQLARHAVVVFHDCNGSENMYVNAAIKQLNINTTFIPTKYGMRIYYHESM